MPSLRRSFSSSSARSNSSPYRSALSNGVRNHGHRRSSGSETSGRRVLADIEWWRVVDGQREESQESDDRERDENHQVQLAEQALGGLSIDLPPVGADRPSVHSIWSSVLENSPEVLFGYSIGFYRTAILIPHLSPRQIVPTSQFSALAITGTPTRRRHSRESSASSLEATPEFPDLSFDSPSFGFADFGTHFEDAGSPPPPATRAPQN
jgi:hypothetical protein